MLEVTRVEVGGDEKYLVVPGVFLGLEEVSQGLDVM